jgi:cyanophycin synthetase
VKIVERRFYRGANVWSKGSGLRLVCSDVPDRRGGELSPEDVQRFLAEIARAVPIATESDFLASPDFLLGSENAFVALVLALCEVFTRDFCVEPRIGELLAAGEGQVSFFLPCDDAPIAVASSQLALAVANAAPEFRIAAPAKFRRHVLDGYLAMRRQARLHGLDQSTIALIRHPVARGIPFSRIASPNRFVQLGQGIHRRRTIEIVCGTLSPVGARIAADKLATSRLLQGAGIPCSHTHPAGSASEALKLAERLGFPLVVKPRGAASRLFLLMQARW